MQQRLTRVLTVVLLAGLSGLACSSDPVSASQIQVRNEADHFQLDATMVAHGTVSRVYSWQNSSSAATIDQSGIISAGSARLVIRDAGGQVVYDQVLPALSSDVTTTGTPGAWQVQLIFTNYTATLTLRIQAL